jgi:hypothetical protein
MSHFSLSSFCAALALAVAWSSAAVASDAKAVKKVGAGNATFTSATGATVRFETAGGQLIPERSVLKTGPGVEVFIEAFPGAVFTVRQNSEVLIEQLSSSTRTARLAVKSGRVISTLDPARKSETRFAVVAGRSVVTAHGTVFSVTVMPSADGGANTSVATLSGIVRIDRGPGLPPLDVPYGQGSANSAAAQTLATLVAGDASIAADILAAVASAAANVASATSAAGTPANAMAQLAAVTSAAASAVPSQAANIAQVALEGVVATGGSFSANPQATLSAIAAVTEAATRAVAASDPARVSAIAQAAASVVSASGATTGGTQDSLIAAVAAVTAAAVNGAPGEANAVAQGAAQGVVTTKVADAISTAKSAVPGLTPEQVAQIATQTMSSSGMTAALSGIATTATSSAFGANGTTGAQATATAIGSAVNAGVSAGVASSATSLGLAASSISSPVVSLGVVSSGGTATITTNVTSGVATATSSQSVTNGLASNLLTQTKSGLETAATTTTTPVAADLGSTVLPALDQNQPIVSPSR